MASPKSNTREFTFKYLVNDIPASLVVFFVALPLCLGIALASGASAFAGIITGIVGGIVAGALSGSRLSVSGPAAGLTVIVLNAISNPHIGGYQNFLVAVVLAGLIQIVLGFLRAGFIGNFFPSNVVKGMLAAIGIILILKQFPHAIGYDKDNEGDFFFLQSDGENTFSEIIHSLNYVHPGAVIIALISLAILILWERPFLKKYLFFKLVPGALIVVITGILINELYKGFWPDLFLSGEELVRLPLSNTDITQWRSGPSDALLAGGAGNAPQSFFSHFVFPNFKALTNPHVYLAAITISIIASLESLLSVEAADKLDPYKQNTPTNRELKAQGVGNMVSGLLGGLPLTAVIVRTSANINAGGRTKLSAILHGVLLLISVAALSSQLNKIPLACLAALLLLVGYKLAKIPLFISMIRAGWKQFIPFIVTLVAIQLSDLLIGISIGLTVSVLFIFIDSRKNKKKASGEGEFSSALLQRGFIKKGGYFLHTEGANYTIVLDQNVSFLRKAGFTLALNAIPENSKVIIDGSDAHTIDIDVLEIIHDFKKTAELKNISLELKYIPAFKGQSGH